MAVVVANSFFLHSSLVLEHHWGQKNYIKNRPTPKRCKCQQELIKVDPELYVLHKNVMQSGLSSDNSRWYKNKSSMQKKKIRHRSQPYKYFFYKSSSVQIFYIFFNLAIILVWIFYFYFLLHYYLEAVELEQRKLSYLYKWWNKHGKIGKN